MTCARVQLGRRRAGAVRRPGAACDMSCRRRRKASATQLGDGGPPRKGEGSRIAQGVATCMLACPRRLARVSKGMGMKRRYDCGRCPGYCCSYPKIELQIDDLERLARHLDLSKKKVRQRFLKPGGSKKPKKDGRIGVLRHQDDDIFGTICIFFDTEARRCGVYDARPRICRDYPGQKRCGYYEFLRFERKAQDDPDYIALTGN